MLACDNGDLIYSTMWTPTTIGNFSLVVTIDGVALEEVIRIEVKEAGIPPPSQKASQQKCQPQNKLRKFRASNSAGLRIRSHPTLQSEQVGIVKMDGVISFIDEIENDDGIWVRLSTESIRQHCDAGWYPPEAWCLQYNQHIDKRLLHPIIEATPQHFTGCPENANSDLFDECETTPTSEPPLISLAPAKLSPRKSPMKKRRANTEDRSTETNPFKSNFAQCPEPDQQEALSAQLGNKFVRSRNPFEKLSKRSGKVMDDSDDIEEYASQDEGEKGVPLTPVPNQMQKEPGSSAKQIPNIGAWTAGVVGSSSKLQAIHKWFKSESGEMRPETPKKRADLSELASVSVRDLVRVIGAGSSDSKGNGNSPLQLSQCSSPILIPCRKFTRRMGQRREVTLFLFAGQSVHSSSSKSVEVSESSGLQNSFSLSDTKEVSRRRSPQSRISVKEVSFAEHSRVCPRRVGFIADRFGNDATESKQTGTVVLRNRSKLFGRAAAVAEEADETHRHRFHGLPAVSVANQAAEQGPSAGDHTRRHPEGQSSRARRLGRATQLPEASPFGRLRGELPGSLRRFSVARRSRSRRHGVRYVSEVSPDAAQTERSLLRQRRDSAGRLSVEGAAGSPKILRRSGERWKLSEHSTVDAGNAEQVRPIEHPKQTKQEGECGCKSFLRKKIDSPFAILCLQCQLTSPDFSRLDALPEMPVTCPPALRCLVFLWEQITSSCVQLAQTNNADENEPQIKDIVLIDDNPLEEFEMRKHGYKKGT